MSSAGLILQRVDGKSPYWKVVMDITKHRPNTEELEESVGGIRGMTAVPNPTGNGSSILLCWNTNKHS